MQTRPTPNSRDLPAYASLVLGLLMWASQSPIPVLVDDGQSKVAFVFLVCVLKLKTADTVEAGTHVHTVS